MTRRTQRKIAKAQVRQTVDDGIKANDKVRLTGMESLLRIRSKKANLQQREQKRLSEKYDTRHERTKGVNKNLDANADYITGLRMEITRATTPTVKPETDTWAVQGYIYDRHGTPLANAEVALYGSDERKVEKVKAVKTNNKGYYKLSFTQQGGTRAAEEIREEATESRLEISGEGEAETEATEAEGLRRLDSQRLSRGLRINTNVRQKEAIFVRASDPKDSSICADSTLITPSAGVCSYRDIIIDTSAYKATVSKDRRTTKYLGNSASRELHDLKNEKNRCQIDAIRFDHCVGFNSIDEATAAGYDFCAYCFGKDKSMR